MSIRRLNLAQRQRSLTLETMAATDTRLSFRARGLHAFLMTQPDDYCSSNKGLWACGIFLGMQTPFFVRPLTADERATLEAGLRSSSAFTVRRCHILLASAEEQSTTTMAHDLRGTDQTVRHALHAFHPRGLTALQPQSSRPPTTATIFEAGTCESLRALFHQSPRTFGMPTSRWTLALAAQVSVAQGLTPRLVSDEAIRVALRRLRVSWKRATH